MTYPAICYLKQLDFSRSSVFEYGAGFSTRFWSAHAKRVISVEHDERWATKIQALSLPNVELIHADGAAYVTASERHAPHDVIIIDGRWRYDCAMACLHTLSPHGLVILDNSERYPAITEHFRSQGLLQIDFIGAGPMNLTTWATSIFLTRAVELKPVHSVQPRYLAGMTDSIERDPRHAALNQPGSF
ncbi:MAG: class I SAM-dependent methyltransferase [Rhodospirillales bacterium]|nr:class I SAM-dependent methyltransferase [Rhodospirillales bacterium]